MATIAERFDLAVRYHRSGALRQAEALYRQILQADPSHADTLHYLGVLAHQTGRSQAGVSFIKQAIALNPASADFHFDLGLVHHDQKQLTEAVTCYRQVLQINSNHAHAHNNLGNVLKDQGHFAEAIECYRQALRINPNYATAHYNLGNALIRPEQVAEAIECYRQALRLSPNHADAHYNLGNALFEQGSIAEAVECYRKAVHLKPNHADAHYNLGNALFRQGSLAETVECYRKALHLNPNHVNACFNLGNAFREHGQSVEAEKCYRQVLRIDPSHLETHNNLGNVLKAQGKLPEAVLSFQDALRQEPDKPEILYNLGSCLHEQGEIDQAMAYYRQALCQRPNYADASNNLAKALKEKGLLDEALAQFRHTLELRNDHAPAYSNLGEMVAAGYCRLSPEEVEKIKAFMTSESCSTLDRSLFSFTLATVAHQQGAYDEAFQYYQLANDLRRRQLQESDLAFDGQKQQRLVDRVMGIYDQAYFRRVEGWGIDTTVPVFIVGMPRSGSTLVEQILSSHPQVFGAGEFGALPSFSPTLAAAAQADLDTTPVLPDQGAALELAAAYLTRLAELGKGASRVINKALENFLHLGLIATLFPRARIIHCRRDPLDVCLACYFQNFKELTFTFSLEDIGTYYRSYEKLMAHWSQVLPLPIHEVCYEELVQDRETVIRALLGFCQLDWDERCLTFFKTPRVVQTASSVQVRMPLFTQAIGRWQHYRSHLSPLLQALGRPADA